MYTHKKESGLKCTNTRRSVETKVYKHKEESGLKLTHTMRRVD